MELEIGQNRRAMESLPVEHIGQHVESPLQRAREVKKKPGLGRRYFRGEQPRSSLGIADVLAGGMALHHVYGMVDV